MAVLIWDVTSAAGAKNYYASSVAAVTAASRQDYYSEGQESPGRYGGGLAKRLDLLGKTVDQETFERLCDNIHPHTTGKPLTPRTNDNRRVCKDFTFSGPKSFSLVEAFASEDERKRLRRAFQEAIDDTIAADIEPDMQTRVRINGQWANRTTGNALTAGFLHATSRPENDNTPPDPHLHGHILFWNATYDPVENRVKAAECGNIVRDKGFYEAAFYARLASKLEAMGYAIDRRGGKEWEIAGIPQSMIDKFSKRTDQIEAEAERLGITEAGRKAALGAKVRGKKQKELAMPELRQAWDAQLTHEEHNALAAIYGKKTPPSEQVTVTRAVAYALHYCSERDWAFPERELKRVALLYGLGHVTPEQVAAELPRHGVVTGMVGDRRMATTHSLHAKERFITGFAASGQGTVKAVGVPKGLQRGKLDDEQWAVVTGLLNSQDRVNLVDSAAGVGKTTALSVFNEGMRLAGRHVTYLGTTTKSVDVMRKDGFEANTLAAFLGSEKMQAAAKDSHVVVDESSMLGQADAFMLFQIAKQNRITLTFLGDSRQHGSVTAGSFLRLLREYGGVTPLCITAIKRQENSDHRAAVGLMFEGKTLEGFDTIDRLGWVHEIIDDARRYAAIGDEYVQARKEGEKWDQILLLCPTHAEGRLVVDAVRQKLKEAGMLGQEEREFTRWVSSDLREAERGDARHFRPGRVDMVQFFQNARGFQVGQRVELAAGPLPPLPFDQAERFQAYRRDAIKLAAGDVLRFTANGKTLDGHQIRNGAAYKVAGFTAKGIRLENGWLVSKEFGHWKHAIETSLGSQGVTVSRTIIAQSSASYGAGSMEQAYVSASRAKKRVSWYTDDKAELRQAIKRSSLKLTASDVMKTHASPLPASRERWRQRLSTWRRIATLARVRAAWQVPSRRSPSQEAEKPMEHHYGR